MDACWDIYSNAPGVQEGGTIDKILHPWVLLNKKESEVPPADIGDLLSDREIKPLSPLVLIGIATLGIIAAGATFYALKK